MISKIITPVKRKISILNIDKIVISKISYMFVIKVSSEYDYLFISEER
jgi:hypothetical protein